jgi:hypothetical protein
MIDNNKINKVQDNEGDCYGYSPNNLLGEWIHTTPLHFTKTIS